MLLGDAATTGAAGVDRCGKTNRTAGVAGDPPAAWNAEVRSDVDGSDDDDCCIRFETMLERDD